MIKRQSVATLISFSLVLLFAGMLAFPYQAGATTRYFEEPSSPTCGDGQKKSGTFYIISWTSEVNFDSSGDGLYLWLTTYKKTTDGGRNHSTTWELSTKSVPIDDNSGSAKFVDSGQLLCVYAVRFSIKTGAAGYFGGLLNLVYDGIQQTGNDKNTHTVTRCNISFHVDNELHLSNSSIQCTYSFLK